MLYNLVPGFAKPALRPVFRALVEKPFNNVALHLYQPLTRRMKPAHILHQYWRDPWRSQDFPQSQLEPGHNERSQLLVKIMEKYTTTNAKILELGCGAGRNLNFLFDAGFKNMEGIEIMEKAVELLQQTYPEMARNTKIHIAPIEEAIVGLGNCQFDVVFAMGVLSLIHKDNKWVFQEIVRITKDLLITVENEQLRGWWRKPRSYRRVFEPIGMKQINEIGIGEKFEGLSAQLTTRIFKKID